MRKPFFRKQTKCWYVKGSEGEFIRLDPDEEKAFKIWEKMRQLAEYDSPDATIEAICEAFLHAIQRKTPSVERFTKITSLCKSFCLDVGPTKRAREVTADDLLSWMSSPKQNGKKWSVARQRDGGQIVKRAIRWAIEKGLIPTSDVLSIRFEEPESRDSLIDYETHKQLVLESRTQRRSRPFGLVLIALWNSGARPIQIRQVTAWHINQDDEWVFSSHKTSKKTKRKLIIRPTPCLATLMKILVAARPAGNLFLTSQGKPWTKDGIVRRLDRMKTKLKIESNVTAYSYRHTFATDSLLAGVRIEQVAELLNHTDIAMVAKVYGHIGQFGEPLRKAAAESVSQRRRESAG
jgi:integrase